MHYDEVVKNILDSNPQTDWVRQATNDGQLVYFLKASVQLRIEKKLDVGNAASNGGSERNWTDEFSETNAQNDTYQVYFGSSLLNEAMFVSSNGRMAPLPLSEHQKDKETKDSINKKIAEIVNDSNYVN